MHALAWLFLAAAVSLAAAVPALAQPRASLALRGGASAEHSEDGLAGTVPALGAAASLAFAPAWRAEVEFWLPGYLKDAAGEPRHRDILFGVSAVRLFRAGGVRPYLLAGLSVTRTQDWFTFCTAIRAPGTGGPAGRALVSCDEPDVVDRRRERHDGTDGYAHAGGGVEIPLGPRMTVVADLRVSVAPVSVILRPSVGVAIGF